MKKQNKIKKIRDNLIKVICTAIHLYLYLYLLILGFILQKCHENAFQIYTF